jgi:hypothetical protein
MAVSAFALSQLPSGCQGSLDSWLLLSSVTAAAAALLLFCFALLQHPSGYEASLDPWLQQLWAVLRQRCPLPPGVQQVRSA